MMNEVALGTIGWLLAVQFDSRGHGMVGRDVRARTVETVDSGEQSFPGDAYPPERLAGAVGKDLLKARRLRRTEAFSALRFDYWLVAIPTARNVWCGS